MKRKVSIILCITMLLSLFVFPAVNATQEIKVFVDNKEVQFDVAPQLIGGRTMVPLRAIFEALGATVNWDEATETVTAYNEAYIVKCTIGSSEIVVNNSKMQIDVPPMTVNDRTLVPARFVAEAFDCTVDWDSDTFTVTITSNPIDYSSLEQDNASTFIPSVSTPAPTPSIPSYTTVSSGKGSLSNPYSGSEGVVVTHQEWSFYPARTVKITCTNAIRGEQANNLIHSENRFNDQPDFNEEWCFFEFNVQYISSEDGSNDVLEGSDLFFKSSFFTGTGSSLNIKDTASFSHIYNGYGIYDTEFYPGSSGKVVVGMLIDKSVDKILLRVPNKKQETNTWILCN